MPDAHQDRLLEIYKLHAKLADKVSQRREAANRLYVSLHAGLLVFMAATLRWPFTDVPENLVLAVFSLVGVVLSASWYVVIRSYRQLNSLKFKVMPELERLLPFEFYNLEWKAKGEGFGSKYWQLTYVEVTLPITFLVLYAGIFLYGLCFL